MSADHPRCLAAGCNRHAAPARNGYCRSHHETRQALHGTAPTYTVCGRCGALVASRLLALHGRTHRSH